MGGVGGFGGFFWGFRGLGGLVHSGRGLDRAFLERSAPALARAFDAMDALEAGAIANPDESRMVGHYWLRDAARAPTPELRREIEETASAVQAFAADVHAGRLRPPRAGRFGQLLVIGIGGSALGPQFVSHALGQPRKDKLAVSLLRQHRPRRHRLRARRACAASSRRRSSSSSRNPAAPPRRATACSRRSRAFKAAGLDFAKQAVAITQAGSAMDAVALREGWLARFPMWDWVGGRTCELCAVGLLPAALQGLDIQAMLDGAAAMDAVTRKPRRRRNPAALLALMWHFAATGGGAKDMVVLPYKDRLLLFSRYLQQLVMESLGKELDLEGNVVHQGIAVYGNKGSTDQHAYVQQLRDGVNNFFVTFIEVLRDREGASIEVEPGVTAGDYLHGFLLGTRAALHESGRGSITLTVRRVDARTVGMLIALYERAVGLYASLVGINAYHQPGVEAGKKAAGGAHGGAAHRRGDRRSAGRGGRRDRAPPPPAPGGQRSGTKRGGRGGGALRRRLSDGRVRPRGHRGGPAARRMRHVRGRRSSVPRRPRRASAATRSGCVR